MPTYFDYSLEVRRQGDKHKTIYDVGPKKYPPTFLTYISLPSCLIALYFNNPISNHIYNLRSIIKSCKMIGTLYTDTLIYMFFDLASSLPSSASYVKSLQKHFIRKHSGNDYSRSITFSVSNIFKKIILI